MFAIQTEFLVLLCIFGLFMLRFSVWFWLCSRMFAWTAVWTFDTTTKPFKITDADVSADHWPTSPAANSREKNPIMKLQSETQTDQNKPEMERVLKWPFLIKSTGGWPSKRQRQGVDTGRKAVKHYIWPFLYLKSSAGAEGPFTWPVHQWVYVQLRCECIGSVMHSGYLKS